MISLLLNCLSVVYCSFQLAAQFVVNPHSDINGVQEVTIWTCGTMSFLLTVPIILIVNHIIIAQIFIYLFLFQNK